MTFPKIYLGEFLSNFFFSYFSQSLLTSSFFCKGNSCEIESSIYFDAMVEMVYFLECFLYCEVIISCFRIIFSYMFSVYFADPVNKKKYINSYKTLKTSKRDFHDDKSDICQFFYQDLFHIVNKYMYKILCKMKMTKIF